MATAVQTAEISPASEPEINLPPTVALNLSHTSGTTATVITATASASDPNNDILTYTFQFGSEMDIGPQTANRASYTFSKPKTHTVTVTVTDGQLMATDAQTIQIAPANSDHSDGFFLYLPLIIR